jgi:putative peptidoglycan lipid II flippase
MSADAGASRTQGDIATQSLARPTAAMAVGTSLSRLTGLGRVAAMAFALGVAESRLADAYNLAGTLSLALYELVLGGVLTSVFIPVLVEELRTKSREEAWRAVSALVTAALTVLVAVSLLAVAVAPLVMELFTSRVPGAEVSAERDLATFFLRVFAPQIVLFGIAAIGAALLNAHGRFAAPAFAPILNNLVVISAFLAFGLVVSGTPTEASVESNTGQKLLLALGATGGVAAMAAVYWPFLRRLPGRVRAHIDFGHPAVRKLARLSGWTLLYVVTNTAGLAVSFYLATGVQGGTTAYVTAFAFFQLPIGIAAVSVITALMPKLSALFVDADETGFRARTAGGIRMAGLLMLPATAAYLILAEPLIETLLEHGIVRSASTELVSSVLQMFAIGLLPFAIFLLMMRAFYARQDARTPALINVVENGVTIGLDFALFPSLGVKGLALAHSLGYVAGCGLAVPLLARRVGGLEAAETLRELLKLALAAGVAAAAMVGLSEAVAALTDPGGVRSLLQLLAAGAGGGAVFLAAARVAGVRDLALFTRLLPGR